MAEQTQPHLTIPQYVADYELGRLDARELLVDTLTNLRHFADLTGEDFESALDTSEMHHRVEAVDALQRRADEIAKADRAQDENTGVAS